MKHRRAAKSVRPRGGVALQAPELLARLVNDIAMAAYRDRDRDLADGKARTRDLPPSLLLPQVAGNATMTMPGSPRQVMTPRGTRYQRYSPRLPDRYLSQMAPYSTPLYDARVHVARAKSHFKRKLHNLVSIFVRVDKNGNGLIPRTEVRRCLAGAGILLPRAEVESMLNEAMARDGEIYWRAITLRLSKIEFNANDGLDAVELSLIAGEFASAFDNDSDGFTTVAEIEGTFARFDQDGDGHIGNKELGHVMRTLGTPRATSRAAAARQTGDKYHRVVYSGRGSEGAYTSGTKNPRPASARY